MQISVDDPVPPGASPSPGPQQSPRLFGLPKPYTGLYSANSYMANRPFSSGYRRSIESDISKKVITFNTIIKHFWFAYAYRQLGASSENKSIYAADYFD